MKIDKPTPTPMPFKFKDVMTLLPFEQLYDFLDNPASVDDFTFALISDWNRPKPVRSGAMILDAMVQAGIVQTTSEARRLIGQGGVRWNGQKVSDLRMQPDFIDDKWGVFKWGKSQRVVVLCKDATF